MAIIPEGKAHPGSMPVLLPMILLLLLTFLLSAPVIALGLSSHYQWVSQ